MESLLEVLYQNSVALRDPQAISEELDSIVRQAEDSERVVREMEALLRSGTEGLSEEAIADAASPMRSPERTGPSDGTSRRVRDRLR